MSSPLILFPDKTAILPPVYFGSIDYYATMAAYGNIVIDRDWRFDKRKKFTHRCTIADTHGLLQLTVPIEKPFKSRETTWNDIKVSTHGEWWNVHRVALESAYGRTPFFEFYIDRFLPFLKHRDKDNNNEFLMDLDCNIDAVIRNILGLESIVSYTTENIPNIAEEIKDYRSNDFTHITPVEYYQVRKATHGFIPNLSILDLIFNMGPEAPIILKKMLE